MEQLLLLGALILVWWLPVLRVIQEMDLIPGIPRPVFWGILPAVGIPVLGPLVYVAWLRPRLRSLGRTALARKEQLERDRRARGAGTEGRPRR
jgi:hypothetical protein